MSVFVLKRGGAPAKSMALWQKYTIATTYSIEETVHSSQKVRTSSTLYVRYINSSTLKLSGSSFANKAQCSPSQYIDKYAATCPYVYSGSTAYLSESNTLTASGAVQTYYTKKYTIVETQTMGAFVEEVQSENTSAYPDNGVQDGYWYVRIA